MQFSHAASDRDLADRFWGGKTGGDWSAFKEQTDRDREAFEKRWAQFQPQEQVKTASLDTDRYAVVSSIFGGYDQPVTLPEFFNIDRVVDCVMVTTRGLG